MHNKKKFLVVGLFSAVLLGVQLLMACILNNHTMRLKRQNKQLNQSPANIKIRNQHGKKV